VDRTDVWYNELSDTVEQKPEAVGLAVVIYNTYTYSPPNNSTLSTIHDGRNMKHTFRSLKFAVMPMREARRDDVIGAISVLTSYDKYPDCYKHFAVVFAGHGGANVLRGDDGKDFNLEDVVIKPFKGNNLSIKNASIMVFIDACRGDIGGIKGELAIPHNMLVAFSTREGSKSDGICGIGSLWLSKLTNMLGKPNLSVLDVLGIIAGRVFKDQGQQPITHYSAFNATFTIPG
jgi:hypothetical protein